MIRRGQDFSIRAVKGSGNVVELSDKHYCKFKNKFKSLEDCPLQDHEVTSVIVHPFGGTVKGKTGSLTRKGNWYVPYRNPLIISLDYHTRSQVDGGN